ncbi:MAG: cohesin domain-containing protein [Candidatus Saccharimonadales bacterium]
MSGLARRLQRAVPDTKSSVPRLYLTPVTGIFATGATFTMTIKEDSRSVAVNAIQANLTYPTTRLEFISINTSTSPFTTTVESTGGSGSVKIGVALLGGSRTGDQIVATVTFKASTSGSAVVSFAAGSVIASEADSTDICQLRQDANYTIS